MDNDDMRVVKRNGQVVPVAFDKILNRIKKIGAEANIHINYTNLAMKVIEQLYDKIPTSKIDELTCEQCASMATLHPDYWTLAGRLFVSNHHKNTNSSFFQVMESLYLNDVQVEENIIPTHKPLLSHAAWVTINGNEDELEEMIDHDRDYLLDYFGLKTLERAYLIRKNGIIMERPQHMWLRVAVGIHGNNMNLVRETYNLMSLKYFTHATPTLFNAGTPHSQLSSCYLVAMEEDSLDGIYNTLKDCANISKWAGGIGLHIHNIRANNSIIQGTNGKSTGIVPMLKVFNDTARFINQGGKRNGSFAIYMEPWHPDIEDFLEMRKNHGDEEMRARDLFYALWIPDLFMERVKANGDWSYFCPKECPHLDNSVGDKFVDLYENYERKGKARRVVKARDLWYRILDAQMETGTPYLLYKDSANLKSNQQNLGTIKSSNLCCEIMEYSDAEETAVCNLASIALPRFVNKEKKTFDFEKLHEVTKVVANNLNSIIDVNFYPTPKTKRSNLRHRPIGIGVQGLADTFILLDMTYNSTSAKELNKLIFETIYHAALEKSNEIAMNRFFNVCAIKEKKIPRSHNDGILNLLNEYEIKNEDSIYCGAYSSFDGSPATKGILQFDMWHVEPSDRYDWDFLKKNIQRCGLRNSLLVAPMPTASTSQILGYNECFEPLTSNIYTRRTLAGEFIIANKYLMNDLIDLGLWNTEIKNNIISNKGSIQHLTIIPESIREKYRIVWEMPMKDLIDMSADRGAFICQSQSMNLWVQDPNYNTLTSMHFYSWKKGLKTGIYYLRRKPRHQPQQFTVEPVNVKKDNDDSEEICEMCSA
jgi:ribonucleotide reductase alpha subunit